jgi:hypothetical protein
LLALVLLDNATLSRQFVGITLNAFDVKEGDSDSTAKDNTIKDNTSEPSSSLVGGDSWIVGQDKSLYRGLLAYCSIQDSLQVLRVDIAMGGILRTLEMMSKLNDRNRVCLGLRFLVKIGRSCGLARQWLCQHESNVLWLLDLFNQWMDDINEDNNQQVQKKTTIDKNNNVEVKNVGGLWGWLDISIIRSQLIEMMNAKGQGGGYVGGHGQGIWSGYDSDDDPNLLVGHQIKVKQNNTSPTSTSSLSSSSQDTVRIQHGRVMGYEAFAHSPGGVHCVVFKTSDKDQQHSASSIDLATVNWEVY